MEHRATDNTSLIFMDSEVSLMSLTGSGTPRWMSLKLLYRLEGFGISDCYAQGMGVYEVFVDVLDPAFTGGST